MINKDHCDRSSSQLKTLHPICIDSSSMINQHASGAEFSIFSDFSELKRAFLGEQKVNAFLQPRKELRQ